MSTSVGNKSLKTTSNQYCSTSSNGLNRNRKSDDRPHHQSSLSDIEPKPTKQVVRVRSFTTRSGTVVNRGDSFKSRSNHGSSGAVSGSTPRLGTNSSRPRVRRRTGAAETDDFDRDDVDEDYGRRKSLAAEYGSTVNASWVTSDRRRPSTGVLENTLQKPDADHQEHQISPTRRCQPHRLLSAVASSGGNEEDYGGWSDTHHGGPPGSSFTVLVQGSARVGKRTLVQQLLTSEYLANKECNSPVDEVPEPHEVHMTVTVQIDDEESTVRFVNRAGGNTLDVRDNEQHGTPAAPASASTHPHHLSRSRSFIGNDGFIVVYSVTDRASFRYAQSCLQELRPEKRCNAVILVANKADVVRNRVVSTSDGARLATRRQCKFIEVSALLDHRVDELLVGIVRQIRLRHENQLAEPEDEDSDYDDYESRYGKLLKTAGSRLAAAIGRLVDRMLTQARAMAASARGQQATTSGDSRSRRLKRKQVDECSNLFTP